MTEKELEQIYKNHQRGFLSWAVYKFNISSDEAKDIFQDSVIVLMQNINDGKMKNEAPQIKSYLYGIAKNKINDGFRKNKNIMPLNDFDLKFLMQDNELEEKTEKEFLILHIEKSLIALGNPCNDLLIKYYFENKPFKLIAVEMNYSNEDSAKTSKLKCIKRLKEIVYKSI